MAVRAITDEEFAQRAAQIRWLLTDVDGVLTDGRLYYTSDGEALKAFDAKDGLGLKLLQHAGIRVGLLSARRSGALERRAHELGLDALMLGKKDKSKAFDGFLDEHQLAAEQIAYIGDDLPDRVVLSRCGLSLAPADAVTEIRDIVHRVLARPGGHGAVREAAEKLLQACGAWQAALAPYSIDS